MALKMTTTAQTSYFEQLFGPSSTEALKAKLLVKAGVTLTVALYAIAATYPDGSSEKVSTTIGTTALLKKLGAPEVLHQNRMILSQWLDNLKVPGKTATAIYLKITSVPLKKKIWAIKLVRELMGWGLKEAKEAVESPLTLLSFPSLDAAKEAQKKFGEIEVSTALNLSKEGNPVAFSDIWVADTSDTPKPVSKPKAKPVPEVVPLKLATAIGQRVKGTSQGSVYHCVALNERVRIAARIHGGSSISIRAEWSGATSEELKKLTDAGLQMKGHYASMHLDAESISPARVIGAFVLGTGIEWTEVLLAGTQLVVEA